MAISFDTSLLLGYYQSRTGLLTAGAASAPGAPRPKAPTAPWSDLEGAAAQTSAAVKAAMQGRKLINENAAQLDLPGATGDYRKLFALYQGLSTLSGVAEQMKRKGLTSLDKANINRIFEKGMAEISAYLDKAEFEKIRLIQGEVATSTKTSMGTPKARTEYVTGPLTDSSTEPVAAFQGDVRFNISVKLVNSTVNVGIDLAEMGTQPRTLGNVVNFINGKLQAAGLQTRFGTERIPGGPRTTEVNGKTVTLGTNPDQWALKVKTDTGEKITFAPVETAGAVYLAQSVGDPDPDKRPSTNDDATKRQLLKFQTGQTATLPAPQQEGGESHWVEGRVFAQDLGPEVKTVRATKVGPDGSVYVLADVVGKTDGQEIKGEQDVALLKYDSAGKLIYTRTLGAAEMASGMALAVSDDGKKIAVAGSVKGVLSGAIDGPVNSGSSQSFADHTDSYVTVFNEDGEELWTQRRGARQDDEATAVTFGADGAVYVAGRSRSTMPGSTALGDWDGYLQAFKPDAKGVPQHLFTQAVGSAKADRMAGFAQDGARLVTATVEDGRGVLRLYDTTSGKPVLQATRDLGDLAGGDIVGVAFDGADILVAGNTRSALSVGGVTRGYTGGTDAFVARIGSGLTASGADRVMYYGGDGDDRATAFAVKNGEVWLAGSAGADIPGHPTAVGVRDGFLARLDVAAGSADWSRRFSGQAGRAIPSAIAVDTTGSSVLDRIGLPKGLLDLSESPRVTAASAVRAGDNFTVKVGDGRTAKVTIEEKDTIDTLAQKIRRASGFMAKVAITTLEGKRALRITPANERMVVEFGPGTADKDALEVLGIPEGVVRATTSRNGQTVPGDGKGMIYGLSLPSDLNLDNVDQLNHTLSELGQAMGVIRRAYRYLATGGSEQPEAKKPVTGPVPAYLTNQIASYQTALARLTGGG